jgi:opacity protein-like surface antigen
MKSVLLATMALVAATGCAFAADVVTEEPSAAAPVPLATVFDWTH